MNEKESRLTVAGLEALAMLAVAAAYRAPTHPPRIVTQAAPSKLPPPQPFHPSLYAERGWNDGGLCMQLCQEMRSGVIK